MKKVALLSIITLGIIGLAAGCGGDDDDGPSSNTGGATTGGASSGGTTGGASSGGTTSGGTTSGGTTSGGTSTGGEGGGGSSDIEPVLLQCDTGCAALFTPVDTAETGQQFMIDLGEDVDLSGATLTFVVQTTVPGNAGGIQFVAYNANFDYDGSNWPDPETNPTGDGNWVNLTDLSGEWVTLTYDMSGAADGDAVRYIGFQIAAGDTWAGAEWEGATLHIDSLTVTGATLDDLDFMSDVGGFAVRTDEGDYTDSSEVIHVAPGGGGGAGGGGNAGGPSAGSPGTAGSTAGGAGGNG